MISTIYQYSLKDHSFTCILSHVVERSSTPKSSVRTNPPNVVHPITGFWLRDPASPKRGFSRFGVQSSDDQRSQHRPRRGVLRSRPHLALGGLRGGVLGGD